MKHLREKKEKAKNIDEMLQEEKRLGEEKKGDEMTEGEGVINEGEYDLEKFHHGVHFGPEDYQNDPDIPDHLLFDEKEFFNMDGVQRGLNEEENGSGGVPSGLF